MAEHVQGMRADVSVEEFQPFCGACGDTSSAAAYVCETCGSALYPPLVTDTHGRRTDPDARARRAERDRERRARFVRLAEDVEREFALL